MPPLPIEEPFFSYVSTDLPTGPRLHFLSCPKVIAGQVTVNIDFGSVDLEFMDDQGLSSYVPPGMAHFLEHFLYFLHREDLISPLCYTYTAFPNAVVSYDFTRWGIKAAWVDDAQLARSVADLVGRFLSLLLPPDWENERLPDLLEQTKADIGNEIGDRESDPDYRLHCKLREVLYPRHPIRYDVLGTRESLQQIEMAHVRQALGILRSRIRSVTVLSGALPDDLCHQVEERVSGLLARPPEPLIRPVPPPAEAVGGPCQQVSPALPIHGFHKGPSGSSAPASAPRVPVAQLATGNARPDTFNKHGAPPAGATACPDQGQAQTRGEELLGRASGCFALTHCPGLHGCCRCAAERRVP